MNTIYGSKGNDNLIGRFPTYYNDAHDIIYGYAGNDVIYGDVGNDIIPTFLFKSRYQMRHTFITLAIKNGVSYSDIAKHCGNSPTMVVERYAGISRDFVMPVF